MGYDNDHLITIDKMDNLLYILERFVVSFEKLVEHTIKDENKVSKARPEAKPTPDEDWIEIKQSRRK